MSNGQMDRGNENPTHICLRDRGKPRKNPSQIGKHRDLNLGSLEYESNVLPLRHLARYMCCTVLYICMQIYCILFNSINTLFPCWFT